MAGWLFVDAKCPSFAHAGRLIALYWPDPPDHGWWIARVEAINCRNAKARLWYDRGANEGEFEDADLTEAIRAGHVSVYHPDFQYRNGPPSKPSRKRHHGDSDNDDLLIKQPRQRKPTAKMAALKGEPVGEAPGGGGKKKAGRQETGAPDNLPSDTDEGEEDEEGEEDAEQAAVDDAEREYQRLLAKRRRESRAAAAAAAASQRPAARATKGAGEEDEKREREQRDKVVAMLAEALRLARGELQAEHGGGAGGEAHHPESSRIPDEQACHLLAVQVEEGVWQSHGQGLSKEYKARIRSLQFNLKDPANPGLRARVLLGEVPPARLATMPAEELASKQLVEWRQQKAQEAVKAVTMELEPDVDKLGRRLRKTHKGEEVVDLGPAAVGGDAGDTVGVLASSSVVVIPPLLPPLSEPEPFGGASVGTDGGDGERHTFSPKLGGGGGRHSGGGGSDPLPSFEAFAAASGHDSGAAPGDEGGREGGVKVHMAAGPMKMVALPSSAAPQAAPKPAAAPAPRAAGSSRHAKAAVPRSPAEHAPTARASTSGPAEWSGLLVSNTPNVSVRVSATPIGGEQAPLGGGLLPAHIHVKGRTHMSEVEKYVLHHIQRGKSTSKALTLAVCTAAGGVGGGQDTPEAASAALNALCDGYAQRDRAGLAQTSGGVEIYLLAPQSELTTRLLACESLPPLPAGAGQLLLALVHRKGLGAAHPRLVAPDGGAENGGVPASPAQGLDTHMDEDDLPDMDASAAVAAVHSAQPQAVAVPDIQASFKSLADLLLPQPGGPPGVGGPPAAAPVISSTLLQMLTQPQGMAPPPGGRHQEDLPEWSFRGPMAPQQQQQHGMMHGPLVGGPYAMAPPLPGVVPFSGAHIPPPRPPPGLPPPRPGMQPQQPMQQQQWMAPGGPVNGGMPPPMQQLPPGFVLGPGGTPVQVMPGLPPPRPPPGPPPGMMPPGGQAQRFDPRRAR